MIAMLSISADWLCLIERYGDSGVSDVLEGNTGDFRSVKEGIFTTDALLLFIRRGLGYSSKLQKYISVAS